jgi:hypothetical protein
LVDIFYSTEGLFTPVYHSNSRRYLNNINLRRGNLNSITQHRDLPADCPIRFGNFCFSTTITTLSFFHSLWLITLISSPQKHGTPRETPLLSRYLGNTQIPHTSRLDPLLRTRSTLKSGILGIHNHRLLIDSLLYFGRSSD